MQELLQAAIHPVNIVFTILLVFILFYWFSVILGAIDLGAFDFDLDLDTDLEVDAEVEAEVGTGTNVGWFAGALHFFNFGKLPFMVVLSFLILSMWSISLLANHYSGDGSALFALVILLPNLFVSLVITKVLTTPLVPVFANLDGSVEAVDYEGLECTVTLSATRHKMGQAEVIVDGSPLLISVKLVDEDKKQIAKGEKALVLRRTPKGDCFLIKHF